jgi:phosphatidate cytidylyltransferase
VKSNLVVRLITALIGAPLILALLYFGPAWGWFAFVATAAAVGAYELFAMTHAGDRVSQVVGVLMAEAVMAIVYFRGTDAKTLLTLVIALPFVAMMLVLVRLGDINTAAMRVAAAAFGPLYVGGGLGAIAMLRRDAGVNGADGPGFVVLALMMAWLSDTGGYFAGRAFGKHKLYEAVSPKKTIEGAIGGLAGAACGAALAHFWFLRSLPLVDGLVLAIVGAAAGQAGDLGESLFKRSFGIKDSGGIVPGHGGILDRADALLVTGSIAYGYVLWMR